MNEQQQRVLAAGLGRLAETTKHASAGPGIEAAIMAEFGRRTEPPAPLWTGRGSRIWGAIAATLMLACGTGIWLSQQQVPSAAAAREFQVIPGTGYLPPLESASIVRVEIAVTALPSYGIAIVPDITTDSVTADLLVAQDGLARGIRLVYDSYTVRSTP